MLIDPKKGGENRNLVSHMCFRCTTCISGDVRKSLRLHRLTLTLNFPKAHQCKVSSEHTLFRWCCTPRGLSLALVDDQIGLFIKSQSDRYRLAIVRLGSHFDDAFHRREDERNLWWTRSRGSATEKQTSGRTNQQHIWCCRKCTCPKSKPKPPKQAKGESFSSPLVKWV